MRLSKNRIFALVLSGAIMGACAVSCGNIEEKAESENISVSEESDIIIEEAESENIVTEEETESEGAVVDSGECGENVKYELDNNGTLRIYGTGDMFSYQADNSPFNENTENVTDDIQEIKNIIIENGVTSIGDFAFNGCLTLREVSISDSVTKIGYASFGDCPVLKEITIPDSVTEMMCAFFNCLSLEKVTLSDGITRIDPGTFGGCFSLKEITIPESVTFISYGAFGSFESLTDVYYKGTEEQWNKIAIDSEQNESLTNAVVHYI